MSLAPDTPNAESEVYMMSPSPHERRIIAALADVDRRTLARYLRGDAVRGGSRRRIVEAIRMATAAGLVRPHEEIGR